MASGILPGTWDRKVFYTEAVKVQREHLRRLRERVFALQRILNAEEIKLAHLIDKMGPSAIA